MSWFTRFLGLIFKILKMCLCKIRANCYRKVREQAVFLFSSISASAVSVQQQHQCISSISSTAAASAASAHQKHQCIGTSAHQHIWNINASATIAHKHLQRIHSNSTLAATVHQQHQRISSTSPSAASAHQHFSSISYMHWEGYLPIHINQFRP